MPSTLAPDSKFSSRVFERLRPSESPHPDTIVVVRRRSRPGCPLCAEYRTRSPGVVELERETGLEPATLCLGRLGLVFRFPRPFLNLATHHPLI